MGNNADRSGENMRENDADTMDGIYGTGLISAPSRRELAATMNLRSPLRHRTFFLCHASRNEPIDLGRVSVMYDILSDICLSMDFVISY